MTQNHNPIQPQPPPLPPRPPPPAVKRRFRWWLIAVPATCLVFAWLLSGIVPGFSFADIAGALGADVGHYGMLASLGVVLIVFVLLYKTWLRG